VTNALQHSQLEGEDAIDLEVLQGANTVRVEISNPGPSFRPPEHPRPGPRGFGFFFVDQLADRWGVAPDRCQVWFEIDGTRRFWATPESGDGPSSKPARAPDEHLPGRASDDA
jgi:hypothetical protein